jgi:hypothetical protein
VGCARRRVRDGRRLKGWNCRHDFYAYIEGVSEQLPKKNTTRPPPAEQEQRYYERMIRSWKRRASTLEAGGLDKTPRNC